MIKIWGYGETWDTGRANRRNVRFVGKMHLTEFIDTILEGDHKGGKWIRDRACETGNSFELELAEKYPNFVVAYDDRTHEILRVRIKYSIKKT